MACLASCRLQVIQMSKFVKSQTSGLFVINLAEICPQVNPGYVCCISFYLLGYSFLSHLPLSLKLSLLLLLLLLLCFFFFLCKTRHVYFSILIQIMKCQNY